MCLSPVPWHTAVTASGDADTPLCTSAEDPELAEFLQVMQPRHKSAIWGNSDPTLAVQQQRQSSQRKDGPAKTQNGKGADRGKATSTERDASIEPSSDHKAGKLQKKGNGPGLHSTAEPAAEQGRQRSLFVLKLMLHLIFTLLMYSASMAACAGIHSMNCPVLAMHPCALSQPCI